MTNNCLIIQNWFVDEPLSSRLRESQRHVSKSKQVARDDDEERHGGAVIPA